MAHLKGQDVHLLIKEGASHLPVASSTSCDFNLTANTADGAAKDDPGNGMFDNPEFQNYSWSASNESFIVSIPYLAKLLNLVINGNAAVDIQFQHSNGFAGSFAKKGNAIISNLTIDAANGDFAKLSLSLDGNGELTDGTFITVASAENVKIKGKALMIAVKVGENWSTIACSSSHKLTVSCNVTDVTDKDYNDKTVLKEVTGKSIGLTTDNLIEVISSTMDKPTGVGMKDIFGYLTNGTTLEMQFGYYPASIGQSIHGTGKTAPNGWGEGTTLVSGKFLCTSLSNNGANKEDSTFSAEFQNKGAVTVSTPAAASED